jgi:peptide/nickel transport system substrate-binding protein
LVAIGRDGRPQPWLAETWSTSADGLLLNIRLRSGVTFHDGQPVTAAVLKDILVAQLPEYLGLVYDDIAEIRAIDDHQLEFVLKRQSAFVLEGLDLLVQRPGQLPIGTGPFRQLSVGVEGAELAANPSYYDGPPAIDRIRIQPYDTPRAAWADLLRGNVDMLFEVGTDALESLRPSTGVKVFTHQRAYAYVVLLNVQKPTLKSAAVRRALNQAINRPAIIANVLHGDGAVADGPVWPNHWSFDPQSPRFTYQPAPIDDGGARLEIHCLFAEASLERLGLELQRQLQAVGVDLILEAVTIDEVYKRVQSGDFDALLADSSSGPAMIRPYWFWHSGTPFNWGHYSSVAVDAALDRVRHSGSDSEYRAGVVAFQRAIVDDPPAIFLAWSSRTRAVSTRFEVPVEPRRDVLSTLRLWHRIPSSPDATEH